MKWVTREKVHVDRVACPWLIKNFVDHEAVFVFVPKDTDPKTIKDGIPFDMKGVDLGHLGSECSFDAIIAKYGLTHDPALSRLQQIVRLADTDRTDEDPLAYALDVLGTGYRLISENDHKTLEKEFVLYDALYATFKNQDIKL